MMHQGHRFCGAGRDRLPDPVFRGMAFLLRLRAWLWRLSGHFLGKLSRFGVGAGQTVIDYGCGPGGYLTAASRLVGPEGIVYAVDIHELAIEAVEKKLAREGLGNVTAVLAEGYATGLPDSCADLVLALDMFHMCSDPGAFLKECRRLVKARGSLILEDGHQRRRQTREKLDSSGLWQIVEEGRRHLRCLPL